MWCWDGRTNFETDCWIVLSSRYLRRRGGCLRWEKAGDGEMAVRERWEGELRKRSEGFLCYKIAPYLLLLYKIAIHLIIKKCHMKGVQSGMPHEMVCVSPLR